MKSHAFLLLGAMTLAAAPNAPAALVWTGNGDGVSLFQEANWLDDNGAVPAAGTIDGNTAVTAATGGQIEISSGTGTPNNFAGNFDLGIGNDLLVGGGKTLQSNAAQGIRVDYTVSNPANSAATVQDNATVYIQFSLDIDWTLSTGATLHFKGGGNPVNRSTIDFADTTALLLFDAETWSAFNTEHKSKTTFQGAPLVFGSDPFTFESGDNALATAYNGTSGVQIQAVPEVSASLLALIGLGALLRRKR